MLFFFFLLDIPKKEERDLKMLTIKCAKKKRGIWVQTTFLSINPPG